MIIIKLGELLEKKDMTQKELSLITNIRPGTISSLVRGTWKTVSSTVLDKLCKALDCTTSDLVEYRKDEPDESPPTAEELAAAIKAVRQSFGYNDDVETPKEDILIDTINKNISSKIDSNKIEK